MAVRLSNYPILVKQTATATNPTGGQVMADTGALQFGTGGYGNGAGIYEILVTASASATALFVLQRRNAANSANVGDTVTFRVLANTTVAIPFRLEAESSERFRVVMGPAGVTGDAEASITIQRAG